ncbi:MAG: hypothetical protein HQ582_15840 [Planctomycetes bacterium]|nr:hypothetical protein [Planctomycetota bacterium]
MAKKTKIPTTPKGLSVESQGLWTAVCREWEITDPAARLILEESLRALDRVRQLQRKLKSTGVAVTDRFGQLKSNPLLASERDARAQLLAGLKALNLDLEPLRDAVGRPPKG